MYNTFFGLKLDPFRTTPDPSMLYLTARHREALAGLSYSILTRKGFSVLSGEAGTGKTTLLARIIQTVPADKAVFSVILNSSLTSAEFLETAMLDFGLEDIPASKALRLQKLQKFLIAQHQEGRTCVLIVDEAQQLSEEVLEEVRLLSNCELPHEKLLQIVLSGQPELENLLERTSIRQLKQRVFVRLRIAPLTEREVAEYIRFRWSKAGGGDAQVFDPQAIRAIAAFSKGIPRLVNILCDQSLILAFCDESRLVVERNVAEAAHDLVLDGSTPSNLPGRESGPAVVAAAAPPAATRTSNDGYAIPEPMPTLCRYGSAASDKSIIWRWARFGRAPHADGVI